MSRAVMIARMMLVAGCVAIGCVAAACGDWPWRHDMANQPSHSTSSSSHAPAMGSLSVSGETQLTRDAAETRLVNPIASTAAVDAGRRLYDVYCVPCHGAAGAGDGPVSKYFGQIRRLDDAEEQRHTVAWLFATITNGTERMPRYITELTPAERWQIVHFVRSMPVHDLSSR